MFEPAVRSGKTKNGSQYWNDNPFNSIERAKILLIAYHDCEDDHHTAKHETGVGAKATWEEGRGRPD
jgi:hypothetical protein